MGSRVLGIDGSIAGLSGDMLISGMISYMDIGHKFQENFYQENLPTTDLPIHIQMQS